MSTFHSDLKRANKDELFIASKLEDTGFTFVTTSPPGTTGWDFQMNYAGDEYRFEQKSDYLCKSTGNVAVEFGRTNGVASGVAATTADFVAYMVSRPDNTYVLCMGNADTFKEMVSQDCFRTIAGGDGKRTLFKVIPYESFVNNPGIMTVGAPFTKP